MSFRENLLYLRQSNNMTQERLAMLLGVSRQSVTKWESEKSYPEMDKLLKMCQIFDCTLDELVQGDMSGRLDSANSMGVPTPPADVFGYDEHMRRFAARISSGVFALIAGVALSLLFFTAAEDAHVAPFTMPENIATALGMFCVFAGVACGLLLIIPAGMEHSQFVRNHPFMEDFYTEDQKRRARSQFTAVFIAGLSFIFCGIILIVLFEDVQNAESVALCVSLLCIASGVGLIIYGGMMLGRMNIENYNSAAAEVMTAHDIECAPVTDEQKEMLKGDALTSKRIGAVCGSIMIAATIAGLVMLFAPGYHTAFFWLAWPIGGLLCGLCALLMKAFSKQD